MDYKIKGDSDCPIVEINLQNNETGKIVCLEVTPACHYYLNNGAFFGVR